MRLYSLLPAAVLTTTLCPTVYAWGAAGHEIVATIAQIHLNPSVYPTLCAVLNYTSRNPDEPQCHLAPVAAWADRFRYRMRWSASLHYVGAVGDHPSQTCLFPGEQGWAGKDGANILSATRNVTNLLGQFMNGHDTDITLRDDLGAANEALKFLIHFMGDLHMPLHLTGRDRGGNSDRVLFDGRQTNLHSLWDGLLIAKAIRSVPRKYNQPLADERIEYSLRGAIYDPYIRQIMVEGVLRDWADEIPNWLSCPASSARPTLDVPFAGLQHIVTIWNWLTNRGDDPGAGTDDEELCPYSWAKPIHALNCEIVWPKELDEHDTQFLDDDEIGSFHSVEDEMAQVNEDGQFIGGRHPRKPGLELDTPEYAGAIAKRRVVEKLLAQAGIRLAAVLNNLFAEDA
ncbi:hypothetical protein AMATHDRAFT_81934 [Amanita thiersii Skay4041]|uniref:Phospholipase C/P1 nuclease n=1 Tax=Amanita thiersii Skay4041 TaxID=703135 RepID=A0A2A9NK52_9AGAR|nr:hypothetical protein AMATHDRAFT_81934 [Amanita thiersii Skay4041]